MGTRSAAGGAGAASCVDIELLDQPMDCCFSQAAPLLASGLVNGQIMLHRFSSSGEPAAEQDEDEDDEPGAATTSNNSISVQEVLSRSSKKGASCRALCFTTGEQQQLVAGFATGTLLLLDAGSGRVAGRLTKAHSAGVNRLLALQGQPGLVAAGDDAGGLRVWDLRSSSQAAVYSYSRHTDFIGGLTQHGGPGKAQQQQALLAVSGDGTLSVHDLRSSKALAHSETDADDELLSVAVMKGGRKVVCGSQSGVLGLWSWGYWADCSDRYPGHPESVDALAKYDEDTLITGSSDGALRIISVLPNKLLGVVGSHAADMPVERLSLSHDRRLLASVSHDSVVKLWDVGRLLADDGDGEEGGDGGEGSSGDWEEAGSGEEDQQQQQQQQQQHDGPAPVAPPPGQAAGGSSSIPSTPAAAVAVVAAAAGAGSGGGGGGSSADEEDSDSDSEAGGRKRRKKRGEKTAMRKGGANKHKPGGNFFADLF